MMFSPPYKRAKVPRVRRGSWPRLIWSKMREFLNNLNLNKHFSAGFETYICLAGNRLKYLSGTHQDVLPHIDNADKRSSKNIGSSDHSGVFKTAHQARVVELRIRRCRFQRESKSSSSTFSIIIFVINVTNYYRHIMTNIQDLSRSTSASQFQPSTSSSPSCFKINLKSKMKSS